MIERRRRVSAVLIAVLIMLSGALYESFQKRYDNQPNVQSAATEQGETSSTSTQKTEVTAQVSAVEALGKLAIKGRAPKTDYRRVHFDNDWDRVGYCDVRNHILKRDMTDVQVVSDTDCRVIKGTLNDPYTGNVIQFVRGSTTSDDVQIDHVVALSDAWQKGAQQISPLARQTFSNDPLNLLAVDGPTNQKKGDGDAATWLPPNKPYRCRYIARQVAVKLKYTLWVTQAEHDAMKRILDTCPGQLLPTVTQ